MVKQAVDSDGLSNDGIFNELSSNAVDVKSIRKHHRPFRPKLADWHDESNEFFDPLSSSSKYVKLAPSSPDKASDIVNLLKQIRYNSETSNTHSNNNNNNKNNKMMRNRNRMIASMLNNNNQRQQPFRANMNMPQNRLLRNHSTLDYSTSSTSRPYSPSAYTPFYYYSSTTSSSTTVLTTHTSYVKQNEIYSIFVSMLTAAVFLVFIMWRWVRIKSDLRKALREQNLADQTGNSRNTTGNQESLTSTTSSSSSSNHPHHTTCILLPPPPRLNSSSNYNAYLIAQHTDNLRSLIAQLTNGEPRTAEEHQQILQAAKHTIQQLKQQTGIVDGGGGGSAVNSQPLCGYYHGNNSRRNRLFADRNNNMPTTSVNADEQTYRLIDIEPPIPPPPTYDSLMSKSSSLPSYHNLRVSPISEAGKNTNSSSSVNDGAVYR